MKPGNSLVAFAAAALVLLALPACDSGSAPGSGPVARLTGDTLVKPRQVSGRALREGADTPEMKAFYEARRWQPAWTPGSSDALQRALDGAIAHGIDPARFKAMIDSDDPAGRELDLTRAALAYADALAHGLADPAELWEIYAIERNEVDLPVGLSRAVSAGSAADWLGGLAPQDREYRALSDAYVRYRDLAAGPQPADIPRGRLLRPGARDARVPQIAARLRAMGYLTGPAPAPAAPAQPAPPAPSTATAPADTTYAPPIVEAMKLFQTDNGLADDGVVGDETIALLNAGPDDRARQLALNLEARRWLAREVPADRIDVNLPAAYLVWYRGGEPADSRRVIVGKPGDETPHLAGAFSQLVVNPPWNVPDRIAAEEILPKGPGYMQRNNMVMREGRVVQHPGPDSALGLVKFDMQNRHAIYLHDTPAKTLFTQNVRYLSHGCVRVDGAVDFARKVAEAYGKTAEFDRKLASGATDTVALGAEVPVRLLYHTVFVDGQGRVGFRPDPYGWDARLAQALGIPAPMERGVGPAGAGSLGP